MARANDFLDCCTAASVERVRLFSSGNHGVESLMRCASCGAYWFYRFHEYPDFATGDDDLTSWWSPLTADEGALLHHAERFEGVDLGFLRTRRSWIDDNGAVGKVPGAPDHGWW
ncbi:hypothetical protein [Yinghuangia seranimata]|uniref:hypothetical protein n=1 Tax=Yinghuangia seranimata TaxID=408067 RepID=UPI00248B2A5F|nr:hypothetical protein [Yinghuangia seranimata]MDI2129639.1 hypothetical protein [Yinghuangia seranimata]